MNSTSYVIGSFRLDPGLRTLFRNTEHLGLSQRAVALLHQLVEQHGEVVTKDKLIEVAWDGRLVEESNLTVQIASLRRVLAAEPGGDGWVETLPRRGYRFIGPVRIDLPAAIPTTGEVKGGRAPTAKSWIGRPSLLVLPFQSLSSDPAQAYLGEGFAEDVTTAISRLKWLVVAARDARDGSARTEGDLQSLARARGIQYVLTGSIRLSGGRLRVTCQVIDTERWSTIFSEKYDRRLGDIFAVQDEVVERLVAVVEPSLLNAEEARASERPLERLDSWGLVARAVGLLHRFERDANVRAQQLLQAAIDQDPGNARAHATLGWALYWATHCSWVEDRTGCARRALEHAQTALHLDPQEPWARAVYGFNLSSNGRHEQAVDELRRVISMQPSFALGRMLLGWSLLRKGDFNEAIAETEKALLLSPGDRFTAVYQHAHGLALLSARRFEDALPYLRAAAATFVEYMGHVNGLISCCGHLGLRDEARSLIEFRHARTGIYFTVSYARARLSSFAHCDLFLEGLAKAGLPE